jgi:hypothetical protein
VLLCGIYIVAGGATCNEEVTRFLYISPDMEFLVFGGSSLCSEVCHMLKIVKCCIWAMYIRIYYAFGKSLCTLGYGT